MIENEFIIELSKNLNILTGTLAQENYKTFYNGEKIIAYKLDAEGFVVNEMEIYRDEKTNKFYCFRCTKNEKTQELDRKYSIEIFYHNASTRFSNEKEMAKKSILAYCNNYMENKSNRKAYYIDFLGRTEKSSCSIYAYSEDEAIEQFYLQYKYCEIIDITY